MPVALTEMWLQCPDEKTLRTCGKALRERARQMRRRPAEQQKAFRFEAALTLRTRTGGTIWVRAAWFSEPYFQQRASVMNNAHHRAIFERLGLPAEAVTYIHWRPETVAEICS